jgi:hypothetical protein
MGRALFSPDEDFSVEQIPGSSASRKLRVRQLLLNRHYSAPG